MNTVASHRPARWVVAFAIAGLVATVLAVIGPPLSERIAAAWEDYRELRTDEITRGQQHSYDLSRAVERAARSTSVAGILRGKAALEGLTARPIPGWDAERGNAIHFTQLLMGRIALLEGNLDAARSHLLEAGKTPGSPQLDDYGPDMTLAQEMLARGESAVVLQYFEECDKFWLNREKNKLAEWAAAVREGRMPDFGPSSGLTPLRRPR
jgi:hypothetical protein